MWKGVCLGTPDSYWIHYSRVTLPESLGIKGVLFISLIKITLFLVILGKGYLNEHLVTLESDDSSDLG